MCLSRCNVFISLLLAVDITFIRSLIIYQFRHHIANAVMVFIGFRVLSYCKLCNDVTEWPGQTQHLMIMYYTGNSIILFAFTWCLVHYVVMNQPTPGSSFIMSIYRGLVGYERVGYRGEVTGTPLLSSSLWSVYMYVYFQTLTNQVWRIAEH